MLMDCESKSPLTDGKSARYAFLNGGMGMPVIDLLLVQAA